MAIRVKFPREPMTRDTTGEATVIQGHAYDHLRADLLRYTKGEIGGRSFVVSGHRGAGKTTLLLALVEDLRQRTREKVDQGARRPILVHLSAPDVYERPIDAAKGAGQGPDGEQLLRHLARKLHLAAAEEFARAYRERVQSEPVVARAELLAASGQLSIELSSGARLEAMRRFWTLAKRMKTGVLYEAPPEEDQGVRELVALDASAESYQIAIGKLQTGESRETDRTLPTTDWADALKSLGAPALAMLTGTAAGFGVAQKIKSPYEGAIVGAVAAVGIAVALTKSVTPALAPKRNETFKFEPDTTTSSLAWRLPRTIDLFFRAGLAPVFVIDELDKRVPLSAATPSDRAVQTRAAVPAAPPPQPPAPGAVAAVAAPAANAAQLAAAAPAAALPSDPPPGAAAPALPDPPTQGSLAEWIEPRLGMLKSVLTEKAFVCFLTGRDYLEKVFRARRLDPHGVLHTLYSDYLFVQYLPADLHAYVRAILERTDTKATSAEERDLAVLPFLVLFRAQLQPIDVRRRLVEMMDREGVVALGRSDAPDVLPRRERMELFAQIAIESVLEDQEIAPRIAQDHHFALLAIDAVYYSMRAWRRGDPHVDVSERAFKAYLRQRVAADAGAPDAAQELFDETVSGSDLSLLLKAMRRVVELLVEPGRLVRAVVKREGGGLVPWLIEHCRGKGDTDADAARCATRVMSLLHSAPGDMLAEESSEDPEEFLWRFDPHGRLIEETPATSDEIDTVCAALDVLVQADAVLSTQADLRIDQLREPLALIHAPNTTWDAALAAQARLQPVHEGSSPLNPTEDLEIVRSYTEAVRGALPTIAQALTLADALRGERPLRLALETIGKVLELAGRTNEERRAVVEEVLRAFRKDDGVVLAPPALADPSSLLSLQLDRESTMSPPAPELMDEHYEKVWKPRFDALLERQTRDLDASWSDVAWPLHHPGMPDLRRAMMSNTASAWSQVAASGIADPRRESPDAPPPWATAAALAVLGLKELAKGWGAHHLGDDWTSTLARAPSRQTALLLVVQPESTALAWPIPDGVAALVLTHDQLEISLPYFAKLLAPDMRLPPRPLPSLDRDPYFAKLLAQDVRPETRSPGLRMLVEAPDDPDLPTRIAADPISVLPAVSGNPAWPRLLQRSPRGWLVPRRVQADRSFLAKVGVSTPSVLIEMKDLKGIDDACAALDAATQPSKSASA